MGICRGSTGTRRDAPPRPSWAIARQSLPAPWVTVHVNVSESYVCTKRHQFLFSPAARLQVKHVPSSDRHVLMQHKKKRRPNSTVPVSRNRRSRQPDHEAGRHRRKQGPQPSQVRGFQARTLAGIAQLRTVWSRDVPSACHPALFAPGGLIDGTAWT